VRQGVETCRDQGMEGLRDRQLAELSSRLEPPVVAFDEAAVATSIRMVSTAYSGMPSARVTIDGSPARAGR
jgi:hypothetical protein